MSLPEDPFIIKLENAVNDDWYYGFEVHGQRGFVTRTGYYRGNYVARALSGCTHANGWPSFERSKLVDILEEVLRESDGKLYVFQNDIELARYLAGNLNP